MKLNYSFKYGNNTAPWTVYIHNRRDPFIFLVGHYAMDVTQEEYDKITAHEHVKRALENKSLILHTKKLPNGGIESRKLEDVIDVREMNVQQASEEIEKIYDVTVLRQIAKIEAKNGNRKTLLRAINDQLIRIEKS